mmetsp:Transcript_57954/g.124496  ORF Transcript_57954/g.124496 Transcript_57954/m.124496 type:complete len:121 (+) Transcript_57954:932-1294(+)
MPCGTHGSAVGVRAICPISTARIRCRLPLQFVGSGGPRRLLENTCKEEVFPGLLTVVAAPPAAAFRRCLQKEVAAAPRATADRRSLRKGLAGSSKATLRLLPQACQGCLHRAGSFPGRRR